MLTANFEQNEWSKMHQLNTGRGAEASIHAVLNIQTAISFPSAKCLQWSSEGQLFFVTKSSVHILTPDHGINFDNESATKVSLNEDARSDPQPAGWFRTIVGDNKMAEGTRWSDLSQEWGAVSLGSIDTSIASIACSPSGIPSDGRTVLALLTSNMDLSMWKAGKNHLKGEWTKIMDVTPFLISHYTEDGRQEMTAAVLQAQTTCMTWTTRPNYQISPAPPIDSSLLILGNRAGCLTFLGYQTDENTLRNLNFLKVSNNWVTLIDVSPWRLSSPSICEAIIALATSNGDVGVAKVAQKLSTTNEGTHIIPRYTLEVGVEKLSEPIIDFDNSAVTAMRWVDVPQRHSILVICKPGIVYLWSPLSVDNVHWSGLVSFELQTQPISSAASAFHPASGITYTRHKDCLLISLYDGSIYTVHNVSTHPTLVDVGVDPLHPDRVSSLMLSRAVRSVFVKVEQEEVDKKTMNRINGFVGYDGGSTFLWAQEAAIPSDFSYKHDAKHSNTIVVSKLWNDEGGDVAFVGLVQALNDFDCASPVVPLHLLRPTFSRLQNRDTLEANCDKILDFLSTPIEDHSVNVYLPKLQVPLNDAIQKECRDSFKRHLFGWNEIIALRLRLSVADFLWKYSVTDEKRMQCGSVAQGLLNSISHRNLRVLIRHMTAVVDSLAAPDIPFILRLVLQSALPGSPLDLQEEGQLFTSLTGHLLPRDPVTGSVTGDFNEQCPACHTTVPLQDITNAVCPNGHYWRRCSITTFILSTPWVRTCVGCSRKAFLPPSLSLELSGKEQLPNIAVGWLVHELLEAVNQCLYCNNSFVSLL